MTLQSGTRLGAYEIVNLIGAGGMGEVYRARDTRLDRIVAIKVLPSSLAADPHLRERFDREARAISSLNHPNICTLYDVGHDSDHDFLVLEYLEGESLADRLSGSRDGTARPALSVDEALRYAIQIVGALDRAHRSGIVHRDLKPANVMLTASGAKLLDFGLAKTAAPVVAASQYSLLPTTPALTAQGAILGTFQYMAPEQVEGFEADARTDIFAFGALLFEMLAGRPAFEGTTRAQLLGAILKDQPPPISSVQPLAPRALDRIVSTCLAKQPDDRWQSARDLMRELQWVSKASAVDDNAATAPQGIQKASSRAARVAWGVAAVLAIGLAAAAIVIVAQLRKTPAAAEVVQFTIAPPEAAEFGGVPAGGTGSIPQVAISPDGRHVVFVARSDGQYRLWVRPIAGAAARVLPGTEGSAFPFWSPDSRVVAFFAGGKLKKVPLDGGPPTTLCDAVPGRGATWSRDNVIVFAPGGVAAGPGLSRVSSAGGEPTTVSVIDSDNGETNHRWPHFLPDGRHFLYTAVTGACCPASKAARVKIGALDTTDTVTLFEAESSAAYAEGHLLFVRDGTLMAQPFDPDSRRLSASAFPIAADVAWEGSRYASFSVSKTGALVYGHGATAPLTQLVWMDRTGKVLSSVGEPAQYLSYDLSPDGTKIAVAYYASANADRDIWIVDTVRGTRIRLTFDPGEDRWPLWSQDGLRIAFTGNRQGDWTLRQKLVNGAGDDEPLLTERGTVYTPTDWSRDGRFIAFNRAVPGSGFGDIWVLPMFGDRKPFGIVQTAANETGATFAPDGRWVAYQAVEGPQARVFVEPFPPTGAKYQISTEAGFQPRWRGDAKELFFRTADGTLMAASVDTSRQFQFDVPHALFSSRATTLGAGTGLSQPYAVTRDGQRFLIPLPLKDSTTTWLNVVLNWTATIQR